MESIKVVNRSTRTTIEEQVYGASALHLLYGDHWFCQLFGTPLKELISRFPFFSATFGKWNRRPASKKKIQPFIEKYGVNTKEFRDPVDTFSTFNDFFIRHLKPEARPIAQGDNQAVIPADGRYLFFEDINTVDGFLVKGHKFTLPSLLNNKTLANKFEGGAMVIARLCPTDYHRYHFPVDGTPSTTHLINGPLYSVNPIATKEDVTIFSRNKRTLTKITTKEHGDVLYIEVGATCVGSIVQTFTPSEPIKKGDEKGYFEFGASSVILLFEPGRLKLAPDLKLLTDTNKQGEEIYCQMGQPLGILQ